LSVFRRLPAIQRDPRAPTRLGRAPIGDSSSMT
jgi:hypothetical protein